VVPDYDSWIRPFVDPDLEKLHKESYTKLQWIFEYTVPSRYFPFGVKTIYRDFSSCRVCIIREVPKSAATTLLGQKTWLEPYAVPIRNHPTPDAFDHRPVEGFSLLVGEANNPDKCLPCTTALKWVPSAFDEGTLKEFSTVKNGIFGFYSIDNEKRAAWKSWFELDCPMTDDVDNYIATHAFHRPLEAELSHAAYLKRIRGGLHCMGRGAKREETVREELTEDDWETMAAAVTTDSVACRYNSPPPPPMLYFTSGSGHVTKFLDHVKFHYTAVLPGIVAKNIVFFLR
jgi:hypothetical protein